MPIKLETVGIPNMVEEVHEEDGEIVFKYKTFYPTFDEDGFLNFNIYNFESVKISDDEDRLFW